MFVFFYLRSFLEALLSNVDSPENPLMISKLARDPSCKVSRLDSSPRAKKMPSIGATKHQFSGDRRNLFNFLKQLR